MKINRSGRSTPLTDQLFLKILESFVEKSHRLYWAIAWYTGERPTAILRLPQASVYGSGGQPLKAIVFSGRSRKCGRTREVPIARKLHPYLLAYRPDPGLLMFPSRRSPDREIHRRTMDAAFRRALIRAKLTGLGLSLYSARRGFCSGLAAKGVGLATIQTLTGHQSLSVLSRYIETDPMDERSIAAINLL